MLYYVLLGGLYSQLGANESRTSDEVRGTLFTFNTVCIVLTAMHSFVTLGILYCFGKSDLLPFCLREII